MSVVNKLASQVCMTQGARCLPTHIQYNVLYTYNTMVSCHTSSYTVHTCTNGLCVYWSIPGHTGTSATSRTHSYQSI